MNDTELLALLRADPERGLAQNVSQYSAFVYKIASARLRYVCTREDNAVVRLASWQNPLPYAAQWLADRSIV